MTLEKRSFRIPEGQTFKGFACIGLFHFLVLFLIAFFLGSGKAAAQDKTVDVEKVFQWASAATPGCACAVSKNGQVLFSRAYGSADLEREAPLTTASLFDIGSVRKQFIAAAALLLVEENKLSLTEDIRKYVPELPDYGHKITLNHLLTHTSGLRDWTGLLPLANGKPEALSLILRQRGLNFTPGNEFSYSNSGYVLLVEILERVSGMPFSTFAQERLFGPLGMTSTKYVVTMTEVLKHRALAYEKQKDGWRHDMYWGNDRGGGAIYSTAEDMLVWNNALSSQKLSAFVTGKLQEPAKLNNGRKLGYGRGLFLETYRGVQEVYHTGGAAGYHAWAGRFLEQGVSIAVLCNSNAMPASGMAEKIADLYVTYSQDIPAPIGPPPALTGDALTDAKTYAGLYFNAQNGEPLRLAVDRDRLRVVNGPALVPTGKGRFKRVGANVQYMSQDEFELNFLSTDQVEFISMEGKKALYQRAKPVSTTAPDQQALAGRYTSDEIGGFFDIAPGKDGLMVRANDAAGPGFKLNAVDKDTYQMGGVLLKFLRDKAGKIIELHYSNPVVRNIKFSKAGAISASR
ncbi:serine hydrolase [Rufibacter sp. LB8]|uniref:serine hydrolase domain-containing protein n=1 Tax=Rufibacter sp. LB8 TaxID=2777781 RepID=UPI00178C6B70|nr:serine hydrolase domain-containing protein [Rufibacter sp. LB8]